jgi:hypothetical protein
MPSPWPAPGLRVLRDDHEQHRLANPPDSAIDVSVCSVSTSVVRFPSTEVVVEAADIDDPLFEFAGEAFPDAATGACFHQLRRVDDQPLVGEADGVAGVNGRVSQHGGQLDGVALGPQAGPEVHGGDASDGDGGRDERAVSAQFGIEHWSISVPGDHGRRKVNAMTTWGDVVAAWFSVWSHCVLVIIGVVAAMCAVWCANHMWQEHERRRRVDAVRTRLDHRQTAA